MTSNETTTQGREIVIERIFDAPVALVWKVWTEPEHMMQWWGPNGYSAPVIENDFRVGGMHLSCMRSADGEDNWSAGEYREIVPMERIVVTDYFADKDGNKIPTPFADVPPDSELLVTVTFEDLGDKTKLTLRHTGFPEEEIVGMATEGWGQTLDKLAAYLQRVGSNDAD